MVYHQRSTCEYGGGPIRFVCIDPMWFDSSGVLHCRATRNKARRAPGTDVWPARDAFSHIEFESHDGCHHSLMFRAVGAMHMGGSTQSGTYITYRSVDFGSAAAGGIDVRVSSSGVAPGQPTGTIKVRLGGVGSRVVATCTVLSTGGAWQTQSFALDEPITGRHDVVLTFEPAPPASAVGNIDWLQFTPGTQVASGALAPHGVKAQAALAVCRLVDRSDRGHAAPFAVLSLGGRVVGPVSTRSAAEAVVLARGVYLQKRSAAK
jgi:hypothetical protein